MQAIRAFGVMLGGSALLTGAAAASVAAGARAILARRRAVRETTGAYAAPARMPELRRGRTVDLCPVTALSCCASTARPTQSTRSPWRPG